MMAASIARPCGETIDSLTIEVDAYRIALSQSRHEEGTKRLGRLRGLVTPNGNFAQIVLDTHIGAECCCGVHACLLRVTLGNVPRGGCLDPHCHCKRTIPRLSVELPLRALPLKSMECAFSLLLQLCRSRPLPDGTRGVSPAFQDHADVRTQHTAPVSPCRQKQTGVSCQTFTLPRRKRAMPSKNIA
jgi:hypothetical protein